MVECQGFFDIDGGVLKEEHPDLADLKVAGCASVPNPHQPQHLTAAKTISIRIPMKDSEEESQT